MKKSQTTLIKTSDATLLQLNYLVAVCENRGIGTLRGDMLALRLSQGVSAPPYTTDWSYGGPIIERERLLIEPEVGHEHTGRAWSAINMEGMVSYGPTPLIASMRCYVASKLGDEIEIPEKLK